MSGTTIGSDVTRRLVACWLSATVLLTQQPMQPPITPLQVNPNTMAAVIAATGGGIPVTSVAQIELRPLGITGIYRAACSVLLATGPRPQLVSGTLNLGVVPPVWTPNVDVAALNVPSTTAFQLSMSPDGLVVVWDNYTGVTSANYPNLPSGTHYTFVCARPSTAVPFSSGNVRALFVGRPTAGFYWTDVHLGDVPPQGGLYYELFYSDATLGGPGDIVRTMVNPNNGAVSPASVVVTRPANVNYCHSPFDLRDSQGRLRAVTFGESLPAGPSDILWTRNATNSGVPYRIMDGSLPLPPPAPPPPIGFSNGTTNGGTFTYPAGTANPYMVEHTLLADSNVRIGQTVAAYAPIRPAGPAPPFVSSFAVTAQLAPVGIPVPGIDGMLLLDLSTLFTDPFGLSMHNNFTGLAERSFGNYPLLWPQMTFPMQMVTLDVSNGRLIFSNVADFTM